MPEIFRQGDVLIVPVAKLPAKLDAVPREHGRVVLAHGEVTGHAHAIVSERAGLFRDPKLAAIFMHVSGNASVALEHEEHGTIQIPPGSRACPQCGKKTVQPKRRQYWLHEGHRCRWCGYGIKDHPHG